jgi:NDP-sugar pyrophosphorylase family protein
VKNETPVIHPRLLRFAQRLTPACFAALCEPQLYDLMPPAPPFSSMKDIFAPMVARGMPLFGYVHQGLFRTVDDLATYEN